MYFDHSKRSYYRFPSRNSVTDFESVSPMYFPDKHSELFRQFPEAYSDSAINPDEYMQDRFS